MSDDAEIERIVRWVVDCGYHLHADIGPGLLESAYEILMFESLRRGGLSVERQVPIALRYRDIVVDVAFRADMVVEGKVLVELKSTERPSPVHGKQVLTYLRLMKLPIGLLINFGLPTYKSGLQRIVNNYGR